jgi:hypothetical protein
MSGRDLAPRVAALRSGPKPKVLFVAGHTAGTILEREGPEQGVAFLPKPFTLDALDQN